MALTEAVLTQLPWQQIATRNVALLVIGVARQANNLHTIAQGAGDRISEVSRGNEHDA